MPTTTVLIVAAGSGQRFGGEVPKQYQPLGGMPILRRSVLAFLNHSLVDEVRVVINPEHRAFYDSAVGDLALPPPIAGGASRQDSCRLGLEALAKDGKPAFVMIHDAARPLIDAQTITNVRKALDSTSAAIAARQVVDTLKRADEKARIIDTVDRSALWQVFTPQAFHYNAIFAAHQAAKGLQLTDDAAVAEKAGMTVTLVPSSADNIKVTTPDDIERASKLLGQSFGDVRTGIGFDVHRLVKGDVIHLGGLAIPHDMTLEGHSDADVLLHALTDALLGAIAAGDIGTHFPPTDTKWKGADSAVFLRHAAQMIRERGGVIAHVDAIVMCEQPRLGPHREAMQKRIAELLDVALDRVSVKATTTERLGFTGRGEGIAAQAVATIRLGG